jgi:type IV secretory pathway TrbL component
MGFTSVFANLVQILIMFVAWLIVVISFFVMAIQFFVSLIEFKLTTLAGFVIVPFGLFGRTAFLAERVLGNVVASGIKILVLAVIIGIGSTIFGQFTGAMNNPPTISDTLTLILVALSLLGLTIFGPGIADGPQLGADRGVGTGLVAAGIGATGIAAAGGLSAAGGAIVDTARAWREGRRLPTAAAPPGDSLLALNSPIFQGRSWTGFPLGWEVARGFLAGSYPGGAPRQRAGVFGLGEVQQKPPGNRRRCSEQQNQ